MFKTFASDKQNNLYGVTGTVGEKNDAQRFLKNFYNVDIIISPSFNKNLSIEYPPILVNNEKEWIEQIIKVVIKEVKKGRAILIINEGIKKSKIIYDKINNKNSIYIKQLKEYTRSDFKHQKININTILKEGEVIITTNLGGRGTDIKLSEDVEKNGGMHVILTFLPSNSRIEKQAFGRTGRQGNRGSYQYIVIKKNPNDTITQMINERNEIEKKRLQNVEKIVQKIIKKDKLFDKFLNFHHQTKFTNQISTLYNLLDKWGFFMKSIKEDENYDIQYDTFINDYKDSLERDFNIFYLDCSNEEDIEKAINICPSYAFAFFYHRAFLNIRSQTKNKRLYKYILFDMETSKEYLFNNVFNVFTLSFQFLSYIFQNEIKNTELNNYFLNKFDTINFMINNIDENIEKIKKVINDPSYEICDFNEIPLIRADFNIDKHFLIKLGFKSINIFNIGKKSLLKRILIGLGLIFIGLCEIILPIVIFGFERIFEKGFFEIGIDTIFSGIKIILGKEDFIGWKNFFKKQLQNFALITAKFLSGTLSNYALKFLNKIGLAKNFTNKIFSKEKNNTILKTSKFVINQIDKKFNENFVYHKIFDLCDFPNKFNEFVIHNISEILNYSLNEYSKIINDTLNKIFRKGEKDYDSEKFTSYFNKMIKNLIDDIIYQYKEIIQINYSELIDDILYNLQKYCERNTKCKNLIDIIVSDSFIFKNNINQIQMGINTINYLLFNQQRIEKIELLYIEILERIIKILNEMAYSNVLFKKNDLNNISCNMTDEIFYNEKYVEFINELDKFYQEYPKSKTISIKDLKNNKNKNKKYKLLLKKNNVENINVIDILKNKLIDEFLLESLNQKKVQIEIMVNSNIEKMIELL